jgi:hypothetical protein
MQTWCCSVSVRMLYFCNLPGFGWEPLYERRTQQQHNGFGGAGLLLCRGARLRGLRLLHVYVDVDVHVYVHVYARRWPDFSPGTPG